MVDRGICFVHFSAPLFILYLYAEYSITTYVLTVNI